MQLTKKQQRAATAKEVIATAQDIKYARFLAGNDKVGRDKAVKSLKKWFEQRCQSQIPFTDSDLLLIWKGLFYSMWMSDKPLVQEECAERIASLIHSLDAQTGFQFFKAGMKTLGNEWFGIDQWREDKFMMFVRRLLRQAFVLLKNNGFNLKLIKAFAASMEESVLSTTKAAPLSLLMHFCDIYMPELAKISEGELNPNILNEFLHPFVKALSMCSDARVANAISDGVFRYLIKQSEIAMEHEAKFRAWQSMGFPGGNIDAMQRAGGEAEDEDEEVEDEEDEDEEVGGEEDEENADVDDEAEEVEEAEEGADGEEDELTGLDPRAGRVNVVLPQLRFSCKNIGALMKDYQFKAANKNARSTIRSLIREFGELSGGDYPFGIKTVQLCDGDASKRIKQSVTKLVELDKQLYGRKKNKKRKVDQAHVEEEEDQELAVEAKKPKLDKKAKAAKGAKKTVEATKTKDVQVDAASAKTKNAKITTKSEENGQTNGRITKKQIVENKKQQKQKQIKEKRNGSEKNVQSHQEVEYCDDEALEGLRKVLEKKAVVIKRKLTLQNRKLEAELHKTSDDLFVRNSGTWFVSQPEYDSDYEPDGSPVKQNGRPSLSAINANVSPPKSSPKISPSPKRKVPDDIVKSTPEAAKTSPGKSAKTSADATGLEAMTSSTSTPLKTSPVAAKKLFETSDWDAELRDGEVELFVPSKKYLAKRKSMGAPADLVEKSFATIRGKSRRKSAGAAPEPQMPSSNKKVKIDLRLNQSQEVHEHHAQLRQSPGIPFDANRRPARPVIKPNAVPSPINPFYNKRRLELKF